MTDLDDLERDLGQAPTKLLPAARKAVERCALEVKEGWRDQAAKSNPSHARRYPAKISYDMVNRVGAITAIIGPSLGGQGSLGFLEEAPGRVRSAPQRNYERPLRDAEDFLDEALGNAMGDALG